MLIADYLSNDFDPPQMNDSAAETLDLLSRFGLSHIPVFENAALVGMISKETLETSAEDTPLIELKDFFEFFYITENASLFEAILYFGNHNSNILPILNPGQEYTGYLMLEDVISGLSAMPFIAEPGAIMVVEVGQKQFSISEIAKIAESNNARIIGLFVSDYHEDKVQIAIKLIAESLSSVAQTFERFDYTVIYKFFHDSKDDLVKDRFQLLMKYLDI